LVQPESFSLTQIKPTGLAYLSAALKRAGRDTLLIDLQFHGLKGLEKALDEIAVSWVGISLSIQNVQSARRILALVRAKLPQCPVVVGGTFPTCLPDKWRDALQADAAVIGEGEETVLLLDRVLTGGGDLEDVPGISFMKDGQLVRTPSAGYIADLDSIAMPDYDQMPPASYSKAPCQIFKKGRVVGNVLTSRGCPHGCAYCAASTIMGKKWRPRSMSSVGDEMEVQVRKFGADEIHVMDDNLVGTRDHAAAFCEEILGRNLRIAWKTPNGVRVEFLDHGLLALMKRSGCYMLGFGVESGDENVLAGVGKRVRLDIVRDRIRMARSHGILTSGYFILGLPGDTVESIERTIAAALDFDLDFAHFNFCVPYPGTRIFSMLDEQEKERVFSEGWHFIPHPPKNMTAGQLRSLHRKACAKFYLRPRNMMVLGRLIDRESAGPFARALAYYFFGHMLPRRRIFSINRSAG